MKPEYLVIIILSCVVVALVGAVLWRVDDRREILRRKANKAGQFFSKLNWRHSAELCEAFTVADYTGMFKEVERVLDEVLDPAKQVNLVTEATLGALPVLLDKDADGVFRAKVLAIVNQPAPDIKASLISTVAAK